MAGGESFAGRLLVATPLITEPTFARTVVFMLDHDDAGSLGVVINRPTEIEVGSVLPSWGEVVTEPQVVFTGGPVSTDSALGVAEVVDGAEPLGWRRLDERLGQIGLIDLDTPPELLSGGIVNMRVFAGYAGWSKGQLEGEIEDGGWYVVDADPLDPFDAAPDDMWRRVLRRQGGELAFVSTYPTDPTMN